MQGGERRRRRRSKGEFQASPRSWPRGTEVEAENMKGKEEEEVAVTREEVRWRGVEGMGEVKWMDGWTRRRR